MLATETGVLATETGVLATETGALATETGALATETGALVLFPKGLVIIIIPKLLKNRFEGSTFIVTLRSKTQKNSFI